MVYLMSGDRGPMVIALQILLNRRGSQLEVDGYFGQNTHRAVVDFQRRPECGLKVDGIVGPRTWSRLLKGMRYSVIDAVDITKPGDECYEPADIRAVGGKPIETRAISGGIAHVAGEISRRVRAEGPIILLRFHGHGGPGRMIISAGTRRLPDSYCAGTGTPPGRCRVSARSGSTIEKDNLDYVISSLANAAFLFAPFGSVELHGCRTGKGMRKGDVGHDLLFRLAEALQVPVSAGVGYQYGGGGSRTTFRFEGQVQTIYPGGHTQESWCASNKRLKPGRGSLCRGEAPSAQFTPETVRSWVEQFGSDPGYRARVQAAGQNLRKLGWAAKVVATLEQRLPEGRVTVA